MAPYSMDLRERVIKDADAGIPSKALAEQGKLSVNDRTQAVVVYKGGRHLPAVLARRDAVEAMLPANLKFDDIPQEVLGRGRITNNVTILGGFSLWLG